MKRPTSKEVLALGLDTAIGKKPKMTPAAITTLEGICHENGIWQESAEKEAKQKPLNDHGQSIKVNPVGRFQL